jgi:Helix-hairpin-helix domain
VSCNETDDATIDMRPQLESATQEVLAGLVERVTYHNAENGFCVLRAKARGHRDVVTVVGHAATIAAGEWITASGEWINDRTHGQQFKARFLRTSPPTSADGIEKYLASGMIRGVGPVYAKKLVRAFGEKVFDVIEATPDRLREVDGIGPVRAASILAAWAEQKAVRGNHGVPAQPRCRYSARGADFQDLWCRRHPGHDRKPVSPGARCRCRSSLDIRAHHLIQDCRVNGMRAKTAIMSPSGQSRP